MQIKRFDPLDVQQALRQVKEALGPEVIIPSAKAPKKTNGRTQAFPQMAMEVVAAIEHPMADAARLARKVAPPWLPPAAKKKESFSPSENPLLERMLSASLVPDSRTEGHSETYRFLVQIAERFSLLFIRSYFFTKIHETEDLTSLFNQLLCLDPLMSYPAKRVPEVIQLATNGRVVRFALNQIQWN